MLIILPPSPKLANFVEAYWVVEDLPGEHAGQLLRTNPVPLAVLSVNIGRPNAAEDGSLVPDVSFLGLQSQIRTWRSYSDTYFVMVMLKIPGVIRLFPHTGSSSAARLLDLAALTGEAAAQSLKDRVCSEPEPQRIKASLDQWLISKMKNTRSLSEGGQIVMAHSILRQRGTVEAAAQAAQTNRRQLHRLFHRHLGMGPKELSDLERLHHSLKGVQLGRNDPLDGFSDQAHQIRSWQRRLRVTPGAYVREAQTPVFDHFCAQGALSGIAYFL